MITAWGDRQIGVWEATTAEADFSPLAVYQFTYTLPEKPWWLWILFLLSGNYWPKNPKIFADIIVATIAAKTEIPEDEIKVLWFSYNGYANKFQIQIKWVPPTPAAIPVAGVLIPIAIIIIAIAIPVSLFIMGKIIDFAPDTIEKLVEEARKGISWITILAGIVVTGSLVPIFFAKSKGG